jgi:hypothetical protein
VDADVVNVLPPVEPLVSHEVNLFGPRVEAAGVRVVQEVDHGAGVVLPFDPQRAEDHELFLGQEPRARLELERVALDRGGHNDQAGRRVAAGEHQVASLTLNRGARLFG